LSFKQTGHGYQIIDDAANVLLKRVLNYVKSKKYLIIYKIAQIPRIHKNNISMRLSPRLLLTTFCVKQMTGNPFYISMTSR